ncbi:MAG: VWA domain-containing protein [Acidobacteriota bacterium]
MNQALIKYKNVLLFLVLLFVFQVKAQDDVIRVDTELVGFEVIVTDEKGIPVKGLKANDFKISEAGIERKIDFFEPLQKTVESRPVSVVFALDVSGSITGEELLKLRNSMQIFTQRLADYNSYFAIMSFGMEVKTLQGFTNKPDKLEKTFNRLLKEQDGLSTHAYDAVDDAIRLLQKKAPKTNKNKLMKRAIVLITDGFPVGDTVTPQTVIERANNAETTIYTIILPSFSRLQGNKKPLPTPLEVSGLVEKTGGRSFYANERDFDPLFRNLAEEITASYALAFYPSEEARLSGKYLEVKIEVPKGLRVKQNRSGYQFRK